ncbi:hypothetical protein Bca101_025912 [Brassica carinata]
MATSTLPLALRLSIKIRGEDDGEDGEQASWRGDDDDSGGWVRRRVRFLSATTMTAGEKIQGSMR